MFCPRTGTWLQARLPRLQFCRRQVFYRKLRNQCCSFTRDWIGAVPSRYFPHSILSLASEQTLKDLKKSKGHQRVRRVDLASWALRTLSKFITGLNISSIRGFDQVRDPEFPNILRPYYIIRLLYFISCTRVSLLVSVSFPNMFHHQGAIFRCFILIVVYSHEVISVKSIGVTSREKTTNRMKHLKMVPWCWNMLGNETETNNETIGQDINNYYKILMI